MNYFLKYLFFIILIYSCKDVNIDYYSFPDSTWNSKKNIKFDIFTKDSSQIKATNISIRHNTSYKYQNIILFLHHSYKERLVSTDTLELLLAEDDGRWIGKGKSNIREYSTKILSPKTYQNGLQTLSLELAMRDNTSIELEKLEGISDISLYLSIENE